MNIESIYRIIEVILCLPETIKNDTIVLGRARCLIFKFKEMDSQVINRNMFDIPHPQIIEKTNNKIVFLSAALLLAGIFTLISFSLHENTIGAISSMLMVSGPILILAGSFLFFGKRKHNVYGATGSVVRKSSYFFNKEQINEISKILLEKSFPSAKPVYFAPDGNSKMDVLMSDDKEFAAVQLSEYIPHKYQSISQVKYFSNAEAKLLSDYLKLCENKT